MLTAPYGGTGGRPIESNMCVEEPDIEIGAGVSSKAISRRMQTDKGGSNGPKSTRFRDDDEAPRWQQPGRDDNGKNQRRGQDQAQRNGQSGAMPGFPFGNGSLPNGMPNFPGGVSYPGPKNGAGF